MALGLGLATGLLAPGTGLAQTVDIGGRFGWYHPVAPLIEAGLPPGPSSPVEKRLQVSLLAGADATVWVSTRLGFAGIIAYAPSSVAVTDSNTVTDHSSSVILVSGRVLFAFTPLQVGPKIAPGGAAPWSFYVGAGAGMASRSGTVWSYSSGRTSPALVLNVGTRTPVGPRCVMRFDIEDYISRARFDKGLPTETAAHMHHDVVISMSVAFRAVR